jgi:hypothetical protein
MGGRAGRLATLERRLGMETRGAAARPASAAEAARHDADWTRYRRDVVAWIDECCWTYDPRFGPDGKVIGYVPFRLFDFQRDYVLWLEDRYREHADAFTEKSRDMGVTWCAIAWLVWHWLFDDDFQALLGSYTERWTDNFLHDSLFGKATELIDHLPDWQRRRARWDRGHPESRKHLAIVNRSNGNTFVGQTANKDFGRGGRYSTILIDEFSKWAFAEQVLQATADASPFRCFVATPEGMNSSGRLRHASPPRVKVMTLHWRLHPNKDEAWYAAECARRTPEDVAQELDISYERSVYGLVLPEWQNVPSGDFPFVRGWPLYVSWDFGLDDNTALIWWQRNPGSGMYRVIDCYESSGKAITFYLPFVTGEVPSGGTYGYTEADLATIRSHHGWGSAVHYGDPAGNQRNQVTSASVIAELAKHHVYVNTRPDRNTFRERWQTAKLFLGQVEGWNAATCIDLPSALQNARFPPRDPDAVTTGENAKPIHDWTSHLRTAVEYMAVNVYGIEERVQAKAERQPSAWMHRRDGYNGMDAVRAALRSRR